MSKTTESKTENKPPEWAEPLFVQSAGDAQKLYDSGSGGNTYLGSTVAPLSSTTMGGVNQLAQAGGAWDTGGARPLFQGIGAESVGPSSASTNLSQYASGENLENGGNPFYKSRLERDLADTAAQTQSMFSGMGRYGSGANTKVLTDRLAGQRISALENDWNREQANQFNAVNMIDQQRNTGLDRALGATSAISGLDQRNFENRLAGAGATLQAGNIVDRQDQAQLADEVAKFYALDNQDWSRLGMLQSAAAGAAGNYGVQNQTTRQPMNVGGLISGIGSLFSGKSDVRLKENIRAIGEANGIPIYAFSYKGKKGRWIGTMAQAIPIHRQDAVIMEDDGYYAVDYIKLGFPMMRADNV